MVVGTAIPVDRPSGPTRLRRSGSYIDTTSWGDRNCLAIGFQYRTDISEALDFMHLIIAAVEAGVL
jgi:hypothetical protein